GANAPRLADYVDLETRGAIKYYFATMQAGEARTLQRAFREAESAPAARTLFDRLIERVLRRLYQIPILDRLDLFAYYDYRPSYPAAAKVHAAVSRLREFASELLREAGLPGPVSMRQYWIGLLRYSAHTLTFLESDERQKRF